MSWFSKIGDYARLGMKGLNKLGGLGSKAVGFLNGKGGKAILSGLDHFAPGLNASKYADKFKDMNKSYQGFIGKFNNPQQGNGRSNKGNNNKDSIEKTKPQFRTGNNFKKHFQTKNPAQDDPTNYMDETRQITDKRYKDRGDTGN